MSEKGSHGPEYPTTLDVVRHEEDQVQIIGSVQTGDPNKDIFLVKNTETGEAYRIIGAKFTRSESQEPRAGHVYRIEEGVKITGELVGGKRQKTK